MIGKFRDDYESEEEMNTVKKIFDNEGVIAVLIAVVMLLGISFSRLFGNTWIMIGAVAIQVVLLFLLELKAGKRREESKDV